MNEKRGYVSRHSPSKGGELAFSMDTCPGNAYGDKLSLVHGLAHPDLVVRTRTAQHLARYGNPLDLPALHTANKRETSVSCKLEIMRAIVALEHRFLIESSARPLACPLE